MGEKLASLFRGVSLRFRSLRKAHAVQMLKFPSKKPRHEKIDIDLFTRKTESDYLDVRKDGKCDFEF